MALWHIVLGWISCYLALLSGSEIGLNENATMFGEVVSVVHNSSNHLVQVMLRPSRRCADPTFIVRMSGSALYMLEQKSQTGSDVFTFEYPCILDSGKYYFEVIAMFCDRFNPSNFSGICMESPINYANVATLPYSVQLDAEQDCVTRPRWKLGTDSSGEPYQPTLLPTRHQRKLSEQSANETCDTGVAEGFCNPDKHDLEEYSRYHWVNATDWRPLIQSVLAQAVEPRNPVIHICYIGDSHTLQLKHAGNRIPSGRSNLKHIYIITPLPSMFNVKVLEQYRCSIAIISFGQWMFINGKKAIATSAEKCETEMRNLFSRSNLTRDMGTTQVYFRTENYNGLGSRYISCPPKDYRSIPAIDMLNILLRKLAAELDFDLIDLMHIQAPHWDSAPDFNHPAHNVFDAQIEWILEHIFASIIARGKKLVTYTVEDDNYIYPIKDPATYAHQLRAAQHALELSP